MNVKVEVVREVRTTYLVLKAKSLEDAERQAVSCSQRGISWSGCMKQGQSRTKDIYVAWSNPVLLDENGEVRE